VRSDGQEQLARSIGQWAKYFVSNLLTSQLVNLTKMKSTAQIKGHPLHPILVSFPIAFFSGSFIFDLAGWITSKEYLFQTAYWMEISGVGFALLAAVPGIIDYIFTVPPRSTAKKRATQHALINSTAIILFLSTWFYRQDSTASIYVIIGLEFSGTLLLGIAGWMGGTLVYRNQIGVNPRYAGAGKWKEEYFKTPASPLKVAHRDELKVNQMKLLHINKKRIVLARTEKSYVAFDDHCTHRGGSLAGGSMICGTVQCPWHGSQFDTTTGEVKAGPATKKIITYKINETGSEVFLIWNNTGLD